MNVYKYIISKTTVLLVPLVGFRLTALAQTQTSGPGDGEQSTSGSGDSGSKSLDNPLEAESIIGFIFDIIDVLLIFAVPIIVLFIMYAGFLFVTARGNETQVTKAKSALLWAVVGGVIALGAKLIIEVLQGTIEQFGA